MADVIDASALLALIWSENGCDLVESSLGNCEISSVNLCEVFTKMADRNVDLEQAKSLIESLEIIVTEFGAEQAFVAAIMRNKTRSHGLSFGDRACLSLAKMRGTRAITADKIWAKLDLGIEISVIR